MSRSGALIGGALLLLVGCDEALPPMFVDGGPVAIEPSLDIGRPTEDVDYGVVVISDGACADSDDAERLGDILLWSRFVMGTANDDAVTLPEMAACVRVFAVEHPDPRRPGPQCFILGMAELDVVPGVTDNAELTVRDLGDGPQLRFENLVCPPTPRWPFDGARLGTLVSPMRASDTNGLPPPPDTAIQPEFRFRANARAPIHCVESDWQARVETLGVAGTGEEVLSAQSAEFMRLLETHRVTWGVRACFPREVPEDLDAYCSMGGAIVSECTPYSTERAFVVGSPDLNADTVRAAELAVGVPAEDRVVLMFGEEQTPLQSCADVAERLRARRVDVNLPADVCRGFASGAPVGRNFGAAVAFADVDDDLPLELVVSAPFCAPCDDGDCTPVPFVPGGLGMLFVFDVSASGVAENRDLRVAYSDFGTPAQFGAESIATLGPTSPAGGDRLVLSARRAAGSAGGVGFESIIVTMGASPFSEDDGDWNGFAANGVGDVTGDGLADFVFGGWVRPFQTPGRLILVDDEGAPIPSTNGLSSALGPDTDGNGVSEWYTRSDAAGRRTLAHRRLNGDILTSEPLFEAPHTDVCMDGNSVDRQPLVAFGTTRWDEAESWVATVVETSDGAELVLLPQPSGDPQRLGLPSGRTPGCAGFHLDAGGDLNGDLYPELVVSDHVNDQVYLVCGVDSAPDLVPIFTDVCPGCSGTRGLSLAVR